MELKIKETRKQEKFVEDVDYYIENGFMVFTAHFLRNRGYCCNNGCRHCPYLKEDDSIRKLLPAK